MTSKNFSINNGQHRICNLCQTRLFSPICITLHLSTLNSDGTLLTLHLVSQGSSARFHSFPSLLNVKNVLLPLHASTSLPSPHSIPNLFSFIFFFPELSWSLHCRNNIVSPHTPRLSIIFQLTSYA